MNFTVSRHVNWMRITNRALAGQRRRRTEKKEIVVFDDGTNGCEWMWQWWLEVQRCAGNVRYSKGLRTKGTRHMHRLVVGARRRCARTLHELVNRRGAVREHSVFGRHNANASIILDDRRLISYCREGRRARAGIISTSRRVASSAILRNELPFLRPRERTSERHVNYNC